jgi:poly-gamma-glutamate synthesis protein (capsule biosynthesis protein)
MRNAQERISIKAVGDVCFTGLEGDPFAFISGELDADLLFCNLECCFTERAGAVRDKVNLRAPKESVRYLKAHGFNLICLANNHMLDYGPEGLRDTYESLKMEGLRYFGAGENAAEARQPFRLNAAGLRVAVLSTADASGGQSSLPTISTLGMRALRKQIERIRPDADLIIVSYHGGIELETMPSRFIMRNLRRIVEAGADVVLAHHPHVFQPVEMHEGGLIAYSLGNFVFDNRRYGPKMPLVSRSAILAIEVSFDGPSRTIDHKLIPVRIGEDCLPRLIEGSERAAFLSGVDSLARSLSEVQAEGADRHHIEELASELHKKSLGTILRYGIRHAGDFSMREIAVGLKLAIRSLVARVFAGKRGGGEA